MAWLVDAHGKQFPIPTNGLTSIGRAPDNDLVIADPTVSQRHAIISFDGGSATLRDLGSSNGTFVGAARVNEASLTDGASVRLGGVGFTFKIGGSPAVAAGPIKYCTRCGRSTPSNSQACSYCEPKAHDQVNIGISIGSGETATNRARLQFDAEKKSGWLAAFLNLVCPGAGYAYCGRWILGAFVFLLFVALATGTLEQWLPVPITFLGLLPIIFIDGFLVAGRYNKNLMTRILEGER
jgi:hypothetical protein